MICVLEPEKDKVIAPSLIYQVDDFSLYAVQKSRLPLAFFSLGLPLGSLCIKASDTFLDSLHIVIAPLPLPRSACARFCAIFPLFDLALLEWLFALRLAW